MARSRCTALDHLCATLTDDKALRQRARELGVTSPAEGYVQVDVRYPLRDKLGTAVAWMDAAAAVTEEPRDSYGARAFATSDVVPYGYTGHAEDPTGLVWGRARYIDIQRGAWLSFDPSPFESRCSYARGSPINPSALP